MYIVEGFKDRLAGETTGSHAYGIPGVDFRPGEKICQLLARHHVVVALDGDGGVPRAIFGTVELDQADERGRPLRLARP